MGVELLNYFCGHCRRSGTGLRGMSLALLPSAQTFREIAGELDYASVKASEAGRDALVNGFGDHSALDETDEIYFSRFSHGEAARLHELAVLCRRLAATIETCDV